MVTQCHKLTPLFSKLIKLGAKIELLPGPLRVLSEVNNYLPKHLKFIALVNCTGTGSAQLVGDSGLVPSAGYWVRVHLPHVKIGLAYDSSDSLTYALPRGRGIVQLGGTSISGWNSDMSSSEISSILTRNQTIFGVPTANALIVETGCGLRPCREAGVRLELDNSIITALPVIHNYGHGGSGFTLAFGCAEDVVSIVRDLVLTKSSHLGSKL